jgi:hypothetical protein
MPARFSHPAARTAPIISSRATAGASAASAAARLPPTSGGAMELKPGGLKPTGSDLDRHAAGYRQDLITEIIAWVVQIWAVLAVADKKEAPWNLLEIECEILGAHCREYFDTPSLILAGVSNDEIKSPVRPVDFVVPQRGYREVSPGHLVQNVANSHLCRGET